ncbi:MAG: A/G-specific adenine glycosylase [Bacteroidota bacterium]
MVNISKIVISEKQIPIYQLLINWYRQNGRDLPWRKNQEPYSIWLSEIILQQTRIQQGLSYYLKFMEQYPRLEDLAKAPVDEVLKLWQGLGYYTRARNLHETARNIFENFDGEFPSDYQSIKSLKGIGNYTAAAIASICFHQPYPVLDGNVYRVVTRYLALDEPVNSTKWKKKVYAFLERNIDKDQPGDFNQAMMELGALICTPRNPDCAHCPLNQSCKAYKSGQQEVFPVPAVKKESAIRFFNYLVFNEIRNETGFTYLVKREPGDIWQGLYEFPLIETMESIDPLTLLQDPVVNELSFAKSCTVSAFSKEIKHKLTHQTIFVRFFKIELNNSLALPESWISVSWEEIHSYPVSRVIEKFLLENGGF